MFDVSFSELLVIVVVALLVIGPEKLPKVARAVGAFVGRMQRYMSQVKEEVNREMRFEELQSLQQEIKHTLEQEASTLRGGIYNAASEAKTMLDTKPISKPKRRASASKALTTPKIVKSNTSKVKANDEIVKKTKPAKPKSITHTK